MPNDLQDDPLNAPLNDVVTPDPAAMPSPEPTLLDASEESATSTLYRAALGAGKVEYYLRIFARFDAADRTSPSWNWAASMITLNWLAFRQLWGIALAYLSSVVAAVLLLLGIGRLVFQLSPEVEIALLAVLGLLAFAVPGLFGNAWAYRHCRRRMESALAKHPTLPEACTTLSGQASSKQRLLWLGLINLAMGGATAALAAAIPNVADLPLQTAKMQQAHSGPVHDLMVHAAQTPASAVQLAAAAPAASAAAAASSGAIVSDSEEPQPQHPPTAAAAAAPTSPNAPMVVAGQGIPKPVTAHPTKEGKPTPPATPTPAPAPADHAAPKKKVEAKVARPSTALPAATATAEHNKADSGRTTAALPFAVNVGLFAQENNVRNARAKLHDAGLPVHAEAVKTPKGELTRVRVGPFATQAEAETAIEKIKPLGLDAVLFRRPAER